jgi:hypothetical protein
MADNRSTAGRTLFTTRGPRLDWSTRCESNNPPVRTLWGAAGRAAVRLAPFHVAAAALVTVVLSISLKVTQAFE